MKKYRLLSLTACLLAACLCLGSALPAWAAGEDPEDWDTESIESEEEILEPQEEEVPEPEFIESEEELPEEPPQEEFDESEEEDIEEPEEEPWEPLISLPDTVSLLPPGEGWQETSTFTLVSDWPCIAALSRDGGETWEQLLPEPGEGGVCFTARELWEDCRLCILPLGDADGDGWVDEWDAQALKALLLSRREPDGLTLPALDLDQSGDLTILDLVRLQTALLGAQPLTW